MTRRPHTARGGGRPAPGRRQRPASAGAAPPASAGSQRSSARAVAFEALSALEERPVFLRTVLDELCAAFDVPGRERALAMEIAAGVTRRRATLDAVLDAHLRAPEARIEPRLRTVLRIGAYQLLFLATPPHAAVFEMVELARRIQPRWTRLVNGVLRAVQRDLSPATVPAPQADALPVCLFAADEPSPTASDTAPTEPVLRVEYRPLRSAPFPAPEADFTAYVAAAFSLPGWLAARWKSRYEEQELLRLAAWFATPGRSCLRINPLRASREIVLEQLRAAGIPAVPGARPGAVRLLEHVRVDRLPGFADGLCSVQDESAQAAAELLDPQPGQQVLDLCAAPGGKSAALAERMHNQGRIIAADTDAPRVPLIASGAARLGLTIIEPLVVLPGGSDVPAGPFDRVLLDVPCSNTGVLGKRPEARWRISQSGIAELTRMQTALLDAALDRLAPGGQAVYSTCSIEPEENSAVVRQVLAERTGIRLVREVQHRPGLPADGGYQALLQRLA